MRRGGRKINAATAPLRMFHQGGFVMSISGTPRHSVAVDEGHEMLINKDCKSSIIHPLPDYINKNVINQRP